MFFWIFFLNYYFLLEKYINKLIKKKIDHTVLQNFSYVSHITDETIDQSHSFCRLYAQFIWRLSELSVAIKKKHANRQSTSKLRKHAHCKHSQIPNRKDEEGYRCFGKKCPCLCIFSPSLILMTA